MQQGRWKLFYTYAWRIDNMWRVDIQIGSWAPLSFHKAPRDSSGVVAVQEVLKECIHTDDSPRPGNVLHSFIGAHTRHIARTFVGMTSAIDSIYGYLKYDKDRHEAAKRAVSQVSNPVQGFESKIDDQIQVVKRELAVPVKQRSFFGGRLLVTTRPEAKAKSPAGSALRTA